MAESKRAEGEEPKLDFPLPPFDAPGYVRREVVSARATVVLALYGLILGQVGSILGFSLRNNVASLGVFFLGLTAIRGVLETCGASTEGWDRKTWAANIFLLFFSWLAAWVLFINRPFVQ